MRLSKFSIQFCQTFSPTIAYVSFHYICDMIRNFSSPLSTFSPPWQTYHFTIHVRLTEVVRNFDTLQNIFLDCRCVGWVLMLISFIFYLSLSSSLILFIWCVCVCQSGATVGAFLLFIYLFWVGGWVEALTYG